MGSLGRCMFSFMRNCQTDFQKACFTSKLWEFWFLHSLITLSIVGLFNFIHSSGWAVTYLCGFNSYFPNDYECWAFSGVHWPFVDPHYEISACPSLLPLKKSLSSNHWVVRVVYVFCIKMFAKYTYYEYFLFWPAFSFS